MRGTTIYRSGPSIVHRQRVPFVRRASCIPFPRRQSHLLHSPSPSCSCPLKYSLRIAHFLFLIVWPLCSFLFIHFKSQNRNVCDIIGLHYPQLQTHLYQVHEYHCWLFADNIQLYFSKGQGQHGPNIPADCFVHGAAGYIEYILPFYHRCKNILRF